MSVQSPTSTYAVAVQEIKEDLAQLIQWMRERQICERPYKYLSRFARRLRFIENTEFGYLIEDAVDQMRLSELYSNQNETPSFGQRASH